jgi:hypothetical protein
MTYPNFEKVVIPLAVSKQPRVVVCIPDGMLESGSYAENFGMPDYAAERWREAWRLIEKSRKTSVGGIRSLSRHAG